MATLGTVPRVGDDQESTAAWIAGGLAGLTGRANGPALLPSAATVDAVAALVVGAPVVEPLALLGERAALAGHTRAGATSCGGSARLLTTADGWIAVNLARPEDIDLLAAWLGLAAAPDEPWAAVTETVASRSAEELVERAAELGLPVAAVGDVAPSEDAVGPTRIGERPPLSGPPLVVDLSALWAGPLCSHLLGLGGARVVKVESTRRPDGGRRDESGFFDLLNHGKASVALDLPSTYGLARLRALLVAADVVIEGSRPRALRGWGIDAEAYLAADDGPRVWVSITAHGRTGPAADRVGFGDDAAAAGGLVVGDDDGPCFLADAVADPLTGITTARAVEEALAEGGTWLLDAALARVAASVARPGPSVPLDDGRTTLPHAILAPTSTSVADRGSGPTASGPVPPPKTRPVPGRARPLGADTDSVLADLP